MASLVGLALLPLLGAAKSLAGGKSVEQVLLDEVHSARERVANAGDDSNDAER